MPKKKKRRLKKNVKRILYSFVLLLIIGGIFFLNFKKIIDLNKVWKNIALTTENIKINFKDKKEKKDLDTDIKFQKKAEEFISLFRNRLPSRNLNFALAGEVSNKGDLKIFLKDTEKEQGYIFINIKDDPEYIWMTLVSALDANPLKEDIEKDLNLLDYIDLRYSKLFYKFYTKNEIEKRNTLVKENIEESSIEEIEENIEEDLEENERNNIAPGNNMPTVVNILLEEDIELQNYEEE